MIDDVPTSFGPLPVAFHRLTLLADMVVTVLCRAVQLRTHELDTLGCSAACASCLDAHSD